MRQVEVPMRGWLGRIGIVLLLLAPLAASALTPPTVLDATPGTDGRAIARFTLRFSDPMVPLGKQGADPIAMACPEKGAGRWTDPTTFVWEYDKPLPGSTICRAELKPGLKTFAGRLVTGTRTFTIDSGGPFALNILPGDGDEGIEEDQAFLVGSNGPVDRASVAASAYCAVDGIGERIPVDLLPASDVERVVANMNRYNRQELLEAVGQKDELPLAGAARQAGLGNITAPKSPPPPPPGPHVALGSA